jgi:DNA-binding MarR family transcriptional regulator
MSLEKDIRQRGFRNEYQKAAINIIYTHNYLVTALSDILRPYDITRQQYNVLRILRGQYPNHASVHLIRERMLDKMSDASRIVERLRLKDLIQRKECAMDKRTVEITITEKGLNLLERMEEDIDAMDNLMASLSVDEVQQLNELLDKIRRSASAEKEVQPDKMLINSF